SSRVNGGSERLCGEQISEAGATLRPNYECAGNPDHRKTTPDRRSDDPHQRCRSLCPRRGRRHVRSHWRTGRQTRSPDPQTQGKTCRSHAKGDQPITPMTETSISLQAILSPALTRCGVPGGGKKRILETIAQLVAEHYPFLDENAIFNNLVCRERLGSTGIGQGIAIPHCRLENCDRVIGVLLTLEQKIP